MYQTTDAISIRPVREPDAERIYARAQRLNRANNYHAVHKGMRVARDGNTRLIRTMEQCAEHLERVEERQRGETRRMARDSMRAHATEASMFREAYRTLDAGDPAPAFGYLYAAAAEYAGIIIIPSA